MMVMMQPGEGKMPRGGGGVAIRDADRRRQEYIHWSDANCTALHVPGTAMVTQIPSEEKSPKGNVTGKKITQKIIIKI